MFTLNQLEMFKLVADTGSFNKAAERAYVTANAVMKQINNLENELDAVLFVRTFRGQQLTLAGERLYKRIQPLLTMCDDIVADVKDAAERDINKIKVGISAMTPIELLNGLWEKVRQQYPNIRFEMVTFGNDQVDEKGFSLPIPGTKVDFLVDSYDDVVLSNFRADGIEIAKIGMHAVMPMDHRLACKDIIELEELENETIIRSRGVMRYIDEFCDELDRREIDVNYRDVEAYNTVAYNMCVESGNIMLGVGNIRNIHPFLRRVPINYDKKCSIGIIYSNNPTPAVKKFVNILEAILSENEGSISETENE